MKKPEPTSNIPLIAVTSGKGGVGKSTLTAALAARLAADGKTVYVIDGDTFQPNLHEIAGISNPEMTVADPDKFLIKAPKSSAGFYLGSPVEYPGSGVDHLLSAVPYLADRPDVIFVDCPPGFNDAQRSVNGRWPVGWIVLSDNSAASIDDYVTHIADIDADRERSNESFRRGDRRRNWDHLPESSTIATVEMFPKRKMLGVTEDDRTIAGVAGDTLIASVDEVDSFDKLVASKGVELVAAQVVEWVS